MEGSQQYLNDTLTAMERSGNPESMKMANELRNAKDVKYVQISAKPSTINPNEFYFSVREFKLPTKP